MKDVGVLYTAAAHEAARAVKAQGGQECVVGANDIVREFLL